MQDQGFGAMANEIFNAMNKLNYYQIGENINQKSKAEADIKTQEAENYENTITKLKAEIENLKANTNNTNETTRGKKHTNDYNEKYGVNSEMPLIERIGAYTNSEGQKEDNKDYNNKINNTINKTKEKLTNTYAKKVEEMNKKLNELREKNDKFAEKNRKKIWELKHNKNIIKHNNYKGYKDKF